MPTSLWQSYDWVVKQIITGRRSHVRCDRSFPCRRCVRKGLHCEAPNSQPEVGQVVKNETLTAAFHNGELVDVVSAVEKWAARTDCDHKPHVQAKVARFL